MSTFAAPLEQVDIERLEKVYETDSDEDEELENRPQFYEDLISIEELIDWLTMDERIQFILIFL